MSKGLELLSTIPDKSMGTRRIVSFNVCGIKNVLNYIPWCVDKSFAHMFHALQADIVCFQETKIQANDLTVDMALIPGYNSYFTFPSHKKGYSGVAIYVKDDIGVLKAEKGITGWLESDDIKGHCYRELPEDKMIGGYPGGVDKKSGAEIDSEGRAIVLDLGSCVLIGLYCPANSTGDRDNYKKAFLECLDARVRSLVCVHGRKVILLGDLNIARELIDSADARQEWFKLGKVKRAETGEEFRVLNKDAMSEWKSSTFARSVLNDWIEDSTVALIDTTRSMHPHRLGMYTCWNLKIGARAGNFGSRIDYILASADLCIRKADILPELLGSDHCPVFADIVLETLENTPAAPRMCTMYTPRFKKGTILHHFTVSKTGRTTTLERPPSRTSDNIRKTGSQVAKARGGKRYASGRQQASIFNFLPTTLNSPNINDGHRGESNLESSTNNESAEDKKRQWSAIFTPPTPPLCTQHGEPCKLMVTKKDGPNRGRAFWMCSR